MDRRAFLGTLTGSILAVPLAAISQTRVYRVAVLAQGSTLPAGNPGFLAPALRKHGYIEGQNLILDRRYAEGRNDRFPQLAGDLLVLKPDVIIADSTPGAIAAKRATATIPIVMVNVSDPVGTGIVESLVHPGGNITGVTDFGTALAVKQVDLLHELAPKTSRLAVLMSDNPVHPLQLRLIQDAAERIHLTTLPTMVKTEADLDEAYASMAKGRAGAVIWLGGAPITTPEQIAKMIALSARTKLPTLVPGRVTVEAGALLSYSTTYEARWATVAIYVDKILKGTHPADLPIEQPTRFELVINLKTAKALGLTIPQTLLQRADQVIE
jgi:ABC-type uncharacterized transport system substrate-binding protein